MIDERTTKDETPDNRRWRRRAIVAGILLAIVCKTLPHDYQTPCEALAKICTAGVLP